MGITNWDKLFVAVPFWFAHFFANLFFSYKVFKTANLPWE